MTLHEVAKQVVGLAVDGQINGEHFTVKRFETQLAAMLREESASYIFQIALRDGKWFAQAYKRGTMYDYYIPDTRLEEAALADVLFRRKAGL